MPGNPLTDPNWATEVSDQIITFVGNVRDKTANNAAKVVRGVVFAMLALFLAIALVVLLLVMLTRLMQSILDIWFAWDKAVYLSYFIVGGLFTMVGALLISKRTSAD